VGEWEALDRGAEGCIGMLMVVALHLVQPLTYARSVGTASPFARTSVAWHLTPQQEHAGPHMHLCAADHPMDVQDPLSQVNEFGPVSIRGHLKRHVVRLPGYGHAQCYGSAAGTPCVRERSRNAFVWAMRVWDAATTVRGMEQGASCSCVGCEGGRWAAWERGRRGLCAAGADAIFWAMREGSQGTDRMGGL